MCGNLGLLLLGCRPQDADAILAHLEAMVAATAIRGAQGAGIGKIQWSMSGARAPGRAEPDLELGDSSTDFDDLPRRPQRLEHDANASLSVVRVLGEKRRFLPKTLAAKAQKRLDFRHGGELSATSVIAHTRFATGSSNRLEELHPHTWVPPTTESVWLYDEKKGFHKTRAVVAMQISHNGDFDGLDAFNIEISNADLGRLLNVALDEPSHLRGDSPKIAGFLDLFRVQGRLAAAARLASLRVSENFAEACSHRAKWEDWKAWEREIFEPALVKCLRKGRVIEKASAPGRYRVHSQAVHDLTDAAMSILNGRGDGNFNFADLRRPGSSAKRSEVIDSAADHWEELHTRSFVHHTFRGFLRHDTYTAVTELLSRAHGSFGIQAHCTLEPGTVILAAEGQPMSFAVEPYEITPIVVFGSENAAVRIPVQHGTFGRASTTGNKCVQRLFELNEGGEVARIGAVPAYDDENCYALGTRHTEGNHWWLLRSGIQVRVYSLRQGAELTESVLKHRCVELKQNRTDYLVASQQDIVAADLADTCRVVHKIDEQWMSPENRVVGARNRANSRTSAQMAECTLATDALAHKLLLLMAKRVNQHRDQIDFLVAGCEISLWVAHQFVSDLRLVFPSLNISCASTNELVAVFTEGRKKTVFTSAFPVHAGIVTEETCVLLISQSGQTFPSLHATNVLCSRFPGQVWILTGEKISKMRSRLLYCMGRKGLDSAKLPRVILNGSGHRPAEPSSVAAVAVHHTLTHVLFRMVHLAHSYQLAVKVLERFYLAKRSGSTGKETAGGSRIDAQDLSRHVCRLAPDCLQDLESLLVPSVSLNLADIAGVAHPLMQPKDANASTETPTHEELVECGERWALHVTETWRVLVLVAAYVVVTVTFGVPIVSVTLGAIASALGGDMSFSVYDSDPFTRDDAKGYGFLAAGFVARFLDALVYIFLGKYLARLLRIVEGRYLWARLGNRTVVIVDSPMVHRMLEAYLSKLFSQAYSFVSINVHGGTSVDDFVHKYTHRVVRGLLLAVGRPDGRLSALSKTEITTLLATKQARFIENPDYPGHSGPEVVSVGHNPYIDLEIEDNHVALPSFNRRPFLDQFVYRSIVDAPSEEKMQNAMELLVTISKALHTSLGFKGQEALTERRHRRLTTSALCDATSPRFIEKALSPSEAQRLGALSSEFSDEPMPPSIRTSRKSLPAGMAGALKRRLSGDSASPRLQRRSADDASRFVPTKAREAELKAEERQESGATLPLSPAESSVGSPRGSNYGSPLDSSAPSPGSPAATTTLAVPVGLHYLHDGLYRNSQAARSTTAGSRVALAPAREMQEVKDPEDGSDHRLSDLARNPNVKVTNLSSMDTVMRRVLEAMSSRSQLSSQGSLGQIEAQQSTKSLFSAGRAFSGSLSPTSARRQSRGFRRAASSTSQFGSGRNLARADSAEESVFYAQNPYAFAPKNTGHLQRVQLSLTGRQLPVEQSRPRSPTAGNRRVWRSSSAQVRRQKSQGSQAPQGSQGATNDQILSVPPWFRDRVASSRSIASTILDGRALDERSAMEGAESAAARADPEEVWRLQNESYAPSQLLAFYNSLSRDWERVQEHQALVQRLFESRAASIERFFAFAVMFHAMAKASRKPWFCPEWQIERSQSNLRVATTAAPVPMSDANIDSAEIPIEIKVAIRRFSVRFTGYKNKF